MRVNSSALGSLQSNSRIDSGTLLELNRATFVNKTSQKVMMVNYQETTTKGVTTGAYSYDADVFGFGNLSEGVTLADVGIYKDLNETFLYMRDTAKSYKALSPAFI